MTRRPEYDAEYFRTGAFNCYLVWELARNDAAPSGTTTALRAVCMELGLAGDFRRILAQEETCIRAWIEPRAVNHLFGEKDGQVVVRQRP